MVLAAVGWALFGERTSARALVGLLVLGVLGTGLAHLVWFWLLGRSLARLGTARFLIPVVGVVAGILTGDRPGPVAPAGIGIVLVGIGLVLVPGRDTISVATTRAAPRRGRGEVTEIIVAGSTDRRNRSEDVSGTPHLPLRL